MLVLFLIISVLVSYTIWRLINYMLWRRRVDKLTANIPGRKSYPIIGNSLEFSRVKNLGGIFKVLNNYVKIMDENDRISITFIGPKPVILMANPKHIETVLSSQDALTKDSMYDYFEFWGTGMIISNGSKWRELRKPLNKILTKPMIESNLTIFYERATKLADLLSEYADNNRMADLKDYVGRYSADTVAVTTFGHELNELENNKWNLSLNISRAVEMGFFMAAKLPYSLSLTYSKYSATGKEAFRYGGRLCDLCSELIDGRLKMKQNYEESLDETPKFISDVILQKAKRENLRINEMGKLTTDVLVGGFDTSSITVASALLLMAIYPEHQEAVYKEVVELAGEDTSYIPTWEQLSKMHYLTRVIKEVLRLYSPPAVMRYITKDIDLGKYTIPEGCSAYIMFHKMHRDPKYWSHPNEFYPDHFLPEETATRPKSAYYPFSWGPRSCPGKLYATISMKMLISILIRKYKFETDLKYEELKLRYSLMMELVQGYNLRIKHRKSSSTEQ